MLTLNKEQLRTISKRTKLSQKRVKEIINKYNHSKEYMINESNFNISYQLNYLRFTSNKKDCYFRVTDN